MKIAIFMRDDQGAFGKLWSLDVTLAEFKKKKKKKLEAVLWYELA